MQYAPLRMNLKEVYTIRVTFVYAVQEVAEGLGAIEITAFGSSNEMVFCMIGPIPEPQL